MAHKWLDNEITEFTGVIDLFVFGQEQKTMLFIFIAGFIASLISSSYFMLKVTILYIYHRFINVILLH